LCGQRAASQDSTTAGAAEAMWMWSSGFSAWSSSQWPRPPRSEGFIVFLIRKTFASHHRLQPQLVGSNLRQEHGRKHQSPQNATISRLANYALV